MLNELVGKQLVNFPDRETGEQVKGVKLHFTHQDERVSGLAADTLFVRESNPCYGKALDLKIGPFDLVYGPRGRVLDIVSESK